jgi:hypothetical protein
MLAVGGFPRRGSWSAPGGCMAVSLAITGLQEDSSGLDHCSVVTEPQGLGGASEQSKAKVLLCALRHWM